MEKSSRRNQNHDAVVILCQKSLSRDSARLETWPEKFCFDRHWIAGGSAWLLLRSGRNHKYCLPLSLANNPSNLIPLPYAEHQHTPKHTQRLLIQSAESSKTARPSNTYCPPHLITTIFIPQSNIDLSTSYHRTIFEPAKHKSTQPTT